MAALLGVRLLRGMEAPNAAIFIPNNAEKINFHHGKKKVFFRSSRLNTVILISDVKT
jgi:hypothetical protein